MLPFEYGHELNAVYGHQYPDYGRDAALQSPCFQGRGSENDARWHMLPGSYCPLGLPERHRQGCIFWLWGESDIVPVGTNERF